jgi:hypothetical protein
MSWKKVADPLASVVGNKKRSAGQGFLDPLGFFIKEKEKPGAPLDLAVAPPASRTEVIGAGTDARRAAAKRRGFMSTIAAGETKSGSTYTSTAGTRSLLGIP